MAGYLPVVEVAAVVLLRDHDLAAREGEEGDGKPRARQLILEDWQSL